LFFNGLAGERAQSPHIFSFDFMGPKVEELSIDLYLLRANK